MAINDVRISVTANITVTDEMAERCLRLLEIWQDDNADKKIIGELSNGRTVFRIVTREEFADEAVAEIKSIPFKEWKRRKKNDNQNWCPVTKPEGGDHT